MRLPRVGIIKTNLWLGNQKASCRIPLSWTRLHASKPPTTTSWSNLRLRRPSWPTPRVLPAPCPLYVARLSRPISISIDSGKRSRSPRSLLQQRNYLLPYSMSFGKPKHTYHCFQPAHAQNSSAALRIFKVCLHSDSQHRLHQPAT